ncbi:transcriptional regulator BolA [Morganella psychrotolerans]|uniref:DNA-binding transcriptional regulator BolA n=1 Tax=Morganella psychrotolerans TaxID=368603 RepID=A0A1B8HTC6_9GAMM|nr:transcriptional regulator BolA [Morganella psychrotolerans]OBU12973.1 transcriptional regulator BolA [Morganella psychrotolerans]
MSASFPAVMQQRITEKLNLALTPHHMDVMNESGQHNVPAGSETHFKVVVVSDIFDGMRLVGRHRHIYTLLADELSGGVHALALHTYTPDEWNRTQGSVEASPRCHGGGQ